MRAFAADSLCRLQDASNPKDPVVSEFIHALCSDTSKEVRVHVLDNIVLSRRTVPYIVARLRDVDATVRKRAAERLRRLVNLAQERKQRERERAGETGRERAKKVACLCFSM